VDVFFLKDILISVYEWEKEPEIRKVKITVKADSNIKVKGSAIFEAEENSTWSMIKSTAFSLVEAKKGYQIKAQWKRNDSSGQELKDTDVFYTNTIIYAESEAEPEANERINITVTTANNSNITIKNTDPIIAKKGVKWSEIEAKAKAKLEFTNGFEVHSFRHGKVDGKTVLDEDTFDNDETVFAVAKQKEQTPGGGSGGGNSGGGGGTTPPASEDGKYNVTFSLIKGRDLDSLSGISIKAENLSDGNKKHSEAFVAKNGDKIRFTVTLKDATNVEEWKVGTTSKNYGTASFTITVDGKTEVTALVDKSQFDNKQSDYIGEGFVLKGEECRTTANGTFVIPSHIGSNAIVKVASIDGLSRKCTNAFHVYIADGIKGLYSTHLLGYCASTESNSNITSIRLPNTLEKIGDEVFMEMPQKVRYLVIPRSVKSIGCRAIYKCCTKYRVALSIYFEHETTEEINTLKLDDFWCNGIYDEIGKTKWSGRVMVKVKNDAAKNKLYAPLACRAYIKYFLRVGSFDSIPTADDTPSNWYQW
jgi:hypothetical protein